MKKKIIAVVLVMTMVFTLLAVSASARATAITSVTLTIANDKLFTTATVPSKDLAGSVTVDASAYYTVEKIELRTDGLSTADVSSQTTALTKGTDYQLRVWIKAKEGYYFPFKDSSMYGGKVLNTDSCPVEPEADGEITVAKSHEGGIAFPASDEEGTYILWYDNFTADDPAPETIDTIEINGVSSLAIGDNIKNKLSVPDGAGYEITEATFDNNPDDLSLGSETVTAGDGVLYVSLKVKDGYKFIKNGSNHTDSRFDGTVKLDGTEKAPQFNSITDFSDAPFYDTATAVLLGFNISFEETGGGGDDPAHDDPSGGDDPSGPAPHEHGGFDFFGFHRWMIITDNISTIKLLKAILGFVESIIAFLFR